jgi:hypothetical protein
MVAVHEVPYTVADDASQWWREDVEQLEVLLAEDRRAEALALFMRLETASHAPPASQRSPSRLWFPRAELAQAPMWAHCHRTSSIMPPTRSRRASRERNVNPSKARHTWSIRKRFRRCSHGSSDHDGFITQSDLTVKPE